MNIDMNIDTLKGIRNALLAGYAAEYRTRRRETVLEEIENAMSAVDKAINGALKALDDSAEVVDNLDHLL